MKQKRIKKNNTACFIILHRHEDEVIQFILQQFDHYRNIRIFTTSNHVNVNKLVNDVSESILNLLELSPSGATADIVDLKSLINDKNNEIFLLPPSDISKKKLIIESLIYGIIDRQLSAKFINYSDRANRFDIFNLADLLDLKESRSTQTILFTPNDVDHIRIKGQDKPFRVSENYLDRLIKGQFSNIAYKNVRKTSKGYEIELILSEVTDYLRNDMKRKQVYSLITRKRYSLNDKYVINFHSS